jgi:putative NADPH-quinone reductase
MTKRIAIIQGHPDPNPHLLHALADGYAEGAAAAGHEVRRIEVAKLEFPLLRTQADFETGAIPPALAQAREDMRWAEHWMFLFPLWHGTMPALFKGFLEHIFRPRFALEYRKDWFPRRLLAGRSARIVVTTGMPVLMYHWYFGAYGLRGFERSMLSFAADPREPLWPHVRRREKALAVDRRDARARREGQMKNQHILPGSGIMPRTIA